jgi:hypothetical protein
LVLQAAFLDCLYFGLLSQFQDFRTAPAIDIGGRQAGESPSPMTKSPAGTGMPRGLLSQRRASLKGILTSANGAHWPPAALRIAGYHL